MKEKYVVVLMSVAIGVLLILSVVFEVSTDREKPTITIPDTEITYEQGSDVTALLEDVKAWDNVDKDLTDAVRIDSIIPDKEEKTAVVTYAVYDSSNNVAKQRRTVGYISAEGQDEADESGDVDADRDREADLPEDEDTTEENDDDADETAEGENTPEVTGSSPVITLTEHEFRIERGGDFTPMNRVASAVDDKDDQAALFRRFSVEGDYDVNTPGTYELKYFCLDSDGNSSNVETLKLIVE
ncbi:MAG: immunoglobulin-like domain-containing protein [Lachnospiraceae bacterium]